VLDDDDASYASNVCQLHDGQKNGSYAQAVNATN